MYFLVSMGAPDLLFCQWFSRLAFVNLFEQIYYYIHINFSLGVKTKNIPATRSFPMIIFISTNPMWILLLNSGFLKIHAKIYLEYILAY